MLSFLISRHTLLHRPKNTHINNYNQITDLLYQMIEKNTRKIALITGSSKRIGKDIALNLAKQGWEVVLHYNRSEAEAQQTAAIVNINTNSYLVQADFTKEKEVKNIIPKINKEFGQVSLLINNASSFQKDDLNNLPLEIWNQNINTNIRAPLVLINDFLGQTIFKHAASPGNIINILDYCTLTSQLSYLSYTLSKTALLNLTKSIASSIAPFIRINGIAPGPALENELFDQEIFRRSWQESPLKNHTNPEEICNCIDFLLATKTITGQIIALDGGKHLIDNQYI